MQTKILSMLLSLTILVFVVELTRRERMTFKYAVGWMAVSVIAVLGALFDQWVYALARWLGFQLTSNFIFFTLLCGFVLLSLVLTLFLCQQNEHNDTIAQKIGLLEFEINKLKDQGKEKTKNDS